ncbi:MAG: glycosyl transferase, partial [Pseudomonadota bacterium]
LEKLATPGVWWAFFASMLVGQTVMITVALRAVWAQARRHLIPAVILLPVYWPLGALAAYRAVVEMFTRPFHWSKTTHGL